MASQKDFLAVASDKLTPAKLRLTAELRLERSAIVRFSYAEWIEEWRKPPTHAPWLKMRGWRYQDQRNLRRIDRSSIPAAGELEPDATAAAEKHREADWQQVANERLRELRQQASFREAASKLRWKSDSKNGCHLHACWCCSFDRPRQEDRCSYPRAGSHSLGTPDGDPQIWRADRRQGRAEWRTHLIRAAVEDNVSVVFTDPELQQRLLSARRFEPYVVKLRSRAEA